MHARLLEMRSRALKLWVAVIPHARAWHKKEKENILKSVGIKCEYGEPVEAGEYRGTFKTVGDKEHAEIIELYVDKGYSMNRVAREVGRSTKTIHDHVGDHDRAVERSAFCPACRRVKSKFESTKAKRS